ncbi:MAG: ubiquinol-cytochrome c reductase iron-sulfur subunit [Nitrospirota bacterium]|nr:ubiquinol-cytochrome c reductase iron-sulfur subunit [Nitrospirota bacterium]
MSDEGQSRRDFLKVTTGLFGACGVGSAAYPFLKALSPTKDLIAAGVQVVDISGIKPGEMKTILWRKQPVFIVHRKPEWIEQVRKTDVSTLKDKATDEERVIKPEWLVCLGICTHLGCIPAFEPVQVPGTSPAVPGWYCPCHGGKYDMSGRRLDGPPPENFHLVPYKFVNDTQLEIGSATFAGFTANIRKIKDLPEGG